MNTSRHIVVTYVLISLSILHIIINSIIISIIIIVVVIACSLCEFTNNYVLYYDAAMMAVDTERELDAGSSSSVRVQ